MNALIKQPSETRLYDFVMDDAGLRPDEVITSVIGVDTVAVDSCQRPIIGVVPLDVPQPPVFSGKTVQVLLGGGQSGVTYKVTIKFSTDASPICEEDFWVHVHEL